MNKFTHVDIAFCNGVVHAADGGIRFGWIMHGQKEGIIGLPDIAVINLGHLSVNIYQLNRLGMSVSCLWIKPPMHVVAHHCIMHRWFATGC